MATNSRERRFSRREKQSSTEKENLLAKANTFLNIYNLSRSKDKKLKVEQECDCVFTSRRSLSSLVTRRPPLSCKMDLDFNGKRRSHSEGCENKSTSHESQTNESKVFTYDKEEDSRNELRPIWNLRAFNNWAKSYLMLQGVAQYSGGHLIGLDLGCSHGRDLKKWFHCKIDHLYMIESDKAAMFECRQRYTHLKNAWSNFYEASFIQEDFTTKQIKLSTKVDIVSSQMAIHKAFETEEKAEMMALNVSKSLRYGGYFVVSITNAWKIIDSLKKTPGGKSFGNSVYQVNLPKVLPKTKNIPEYGVRFEFNVGSNQFQEYLVQMPVLEKLMAKHGLRLEDRKSFLELYFSTRQDSEQVKCMQKMGVVRWGYSKKDRKRIYLTMSSDEREAASLFEALIFKKVSESGIVGKGNMTPK